MAHSLLAPSGAHRWTMCPASVSLARLLESEAGADAAEGTLAHELAAALLTTPAMRRARLDLDSRPGALPRAPEAVRAAIRKAGFDVDGIEADVSSYVDFVSAHPRYEVERTLDLSGSTHETGAIGTADAVSDSGELLLVADLKMGRIPVRANGNAQLTLYAHAVLREDMARGIYRADEYPVRLAIVQPRLSRTPQTWDTTAGHIRTQVASWAEKARRALYLVEKPGETSPEDFAAGSWCRYCRAAGFCSALAEDCLSVLEESSPRPERMDSAALAEAWRKLPQVETWCKAVSSEVFARLASGGSVPGLMLGKGKKGARKWADEAAAERWASSTFGDAAFDRSLKSAPQLEKALLKDAPEEVKKAFAALVVQNEGAPKVVEGTPEPPAEEAALAFPDMTEKKEVPAEAAPAEKPKKKRAAKKKETEETQSETEGRKAE